MTTQLPLGLSPDLERDLDAIDKLVAQIRQRGDAHCYFDAAEIFEIAGRICDRINATYHSDMIRQAIARSISHTEIVTLHYTAELEAALDRVADDSVDANGTVEAWGTTPGGSEWRVHLSKGD